jgi:hypothetical protein
MAGVMHAAEDTGAPLVYGDNLYAYGPVEGPLTEVLPPKASGPNGRLRADLAARLLDAHRTGRLRATIGRASDFFGPRVRLATVGERVFGALLRGKPAELLGKLDVYHTITYIYDFAEALATLGERDEALGEVWHVPSAETLSLRQFVGLVAAEAGQPVRLQVTPSWIIRVLACSTQPCVPWPSSCISPSGLGWSTTPNLQAHSARTRHPIPRRLPERWTGTAPHDSDASRIAVTAALLAPDTPPLLLAATFSLYRLYSIGDEIDPAQATTLLRAQSAGAAIHPASVRPTVSRSLSYRCDSTSGASPHLVGVGDESNLIDARLFTSEMLHAHVGRLAVTDSYPRCNRRETLMGLSPAMVDDLSSTSVPPMFPEPITAMFMPHHNRAGSLVHSKPAGLAPRSVARCCLVHRQQQQ